MQRTRLAIIGAAVGALTLTGLAAAQQAGTMDKETKEEVKPLKIGDPARDIDIEHWVKTGTMDSGREFKPLTTFEDGKVYVLEFWATWCGPCVASMPHLSEMQEKYDDYDVTFIGVSDEPLPTVVSFLFKENKNDKKINNDRIGYTLTTDPDRSVYNDYFKAAGQSGIPCAFIIGKDSHVEWIGHPMTMDKPLEQIVHDNWDRDAFVAKNKQMQKLQTHMQKGEFKDALELINVMLEDDLENSGLLWQKAYILLAQLDRPKEGYPVARRLMTMQWDDAGFLNQIAWTIVDSPDIKTRDLDIALKAATRANELTDKQDPAILDTLARVYFDKGDLKAAVKWQREAVKNASDDMMGEQIRETLKKYEDAK